MLLLFSSSLQGYTRKRSQQGDTAHTSDVDGWNIMICVTDHTVIAPLGGLRRRASKVHV